MTIYEDFTTFTEVDVGADRIQKAANHVDHLAYRNESTYLYKDYGSAHFGDFTHKIKVRSDGGASNNGALWMLANNIGELKTLKDSSYNHIFLFGFGTTFYLREVYSGSNYSDSMSFTADTWYYVKVVKSGTSLNAYVYSDSNYSNLLDTLTLTLHADHTFRYLYACNTYNDGQTHNGNNDIDNFDIGNRICADTGAGTDGISSLSKDIVSSDTGSGAESEVVDKGYEDFTTYTEVDVAGDRIQKTIHHIDHLTYRNETTYLYKDYGIAHFDDFEHKIKVRFVSSSEAWSGGHTWLLANDVAGAYWMENNNKTYLSIFLISNGSNNPRILLREMYNGTYYDDEYICSLNTWYYVKIVKSGTSINAYVYSDSDYSNLVDTLTATLHANHTLRYLYGCNSDNDGSNQNGVLDIENFDTSEATSKTIPTEHILDSMDVTTGWQAQAGMTSITVNTTTKKEGAAALNLIKGAADDTDAYIDKTISSTDLTSKYVKVWLYLKDTATVNKISQAQIYLYDASSNYRAWDTTDLTTGWNLIIADTDSTPDHQSGTPGNLAAITKIELDVDTNQATDTYAEGDVIADYYHYNGFDISDTGSGVESLGSRELVTQEEGSGVDSIGPRSFCAEDIGIGEESFPPAFGTHFDIVVADGTSTKEESIPSGSRYGNIYLSDFFLNVPALLTANKTAKLELLTERGNIIYSTGDLDASIAKSYSFHYSRALKGITKYRITTDENVTDAKAFEIEIRGLRDPYSLTEVGLSDDDTGSGVDTLEGIVKTLAKTSSDIGRGEESFPPVFGTYFNVHVADGTSTKEETIPSDSRYANIFLSSIFLKVPALSTPQKTARLELITERGNIVYSTMDLDASTAKEYHFFMYRALKGATKYKITTDANVTDVNAFEIELRGLRTPYSLTEIEASDSDNDTGSAIEASSFSYRDCVSADNGSAIDALGSRELALNDIGTGIDVGERRYPPAESRGYYYAKIGSTIFRNLNKDSFRITEELNKIPSFEFEISNSAANRAAITAGITDILRIYHRHDSSDTLMFTGIINGDAIEYLSLEHIRLVGYASYIDLNWRFHQHLNSEDAEDVGKCFVYSGSYSDKTTAANNDTINDVTITFSSVNDALYIGQAETFFGMQVKYSTKGVQAANTTVIWEYSEGSSVWSTLDVLDETRQFTQDTGTYYITIPHKPSDWAKETVNSVKKFWIRARLTAGSYSTQPKLDRIKMMNIDPYRVYYFDTAASTIMDEVLDGTGYSMDVTDACPSDTISIVAEYETKLRMIAGVANALTWDDSGDKRAYQWWVDTSKKVHFKQKRGSTLGDITKELTILNNVQDYFNLSNRLHFLGNYDGRFQVRAICENTDSQDTHEIRELAVPEERYNNYTPLKEAAQKAMTYTKAPLQKIAATVTTKYWIDEGFEVGDTVTLHHDRWNVDETAFQIVRADIGPRITNLDMGISQDHLDGLKAGLQRQLDISGIRMHGSTSIFQIGPVNENYQRVNDSTVYPSRLKFDIPSDARYIHKILISWKLGNYRADVSGGSESEGHDHTGAAGAGGGFGGGNVTAGGGFSGGSVTAGGAHLPIALAAGAHAHDTDLEVSWVKTHRLGYMSDTKYTLYESSHTHSNPTTSLQSQGHTHSVESTGGPSSTTEVVEAVNWGEWCESCYYWLISTTDEVYVASSSHTHSNPNTGGMSHGHTHTQGSSGAGTSHRHTLDTHATAYLYLMDFTLGVAASYTEPAHDTTINSVGTHNDHITPAVGTHNDHITPAVGTHNDHIIPTQAGADVDLTLGIVEEAGGTVMELVVNGETVASTYDGDQSDIVITGYTNTGSNTLELQPAIGQNHKGGAAIVGTCIVFLEAKK